MRVGMRVTCIKCGHTKAPHGRSVPMEGPLYCTQECPGYELDPKPGCLWPGETEEEFGYKICHYATEEEPCEPKS